MKKLVIMLKVAAAAVAGYQLVKMIRSRTTVPNRLFFYSPVKDYRDLVATWTVATIGKNFFVMEPPLALFGYFTFVVSAARGGKKWLFFYNLSGSACTAIIDRNYVFYIKKTYHDGDLNLPWRFITVDGNGDLLLVGFKKTEKEDTPIGFAQVLDDGSYVEWWRSRSRLPTPDWTKGLPMGHGWYAKDKGGTGGNFYIFDVKHGQVITTRRWEGDQWDGVACEGNIFFFWNNQWTSDLCLLDANNQLVTLKARTFDRELIEGRPFNQVTSSQGVHYCWEFALGGPSLEPRIRTLNKDGFPLTHEVKLADFWYYVVPC